MTAWHVGDVVDLRGSFADENGQPVDPTTPTLTIIQPDATVVQISGAQLNHLSTGNYSHLYTIAQAGVTQYTWSAAGNVTCTGSGILVADTAPRDGVCQPWCTWDDVLKCQRGTDVSGLVDESIQAMILDLSTEVLYNLTERLYPGVCETSKIPALAAPPIPWPWAGVGTGYAAQGPAADVQTPRKVAAMDLGADSGLMPVLGIKSVVIEAATLPATAYYLEEWRWLHRIDGNAWPYLQDATDPNKNRVTWWYGRIPTTALARAAALFAYEQAKWCVGHKCEFPERVTTVSRNQVTYVVIDSMKFIQEGRTGVYLIDEILESWRKGRVVQPGAFDADARSGMRNIPGNPPLVTPYGG
jgi:hypothetical protein